MREAILVASGDLRETANRLGWPAQERLEGHVRAAFARHGVAIRRGHPVDGTRGDGFISSQRMGMDVFAGLDGVTRDQMMARHRANHIQVAYGADAVSADAALAAKAVMFDALGVAVHLCGDVAI